MMLRVLNIATGAERYYDGSLGAVRAVASAFAQAERNDWDSRAYEAKYFPQIKWLGEIVYLDHWVCFARI